MKEHRLALGELAAKGILLASFLGAMAFGEKPREAEVKPSAAAIKVHEDPEGISQYIHPPAPILKARRVAAPLGKGRSDIGPTDLTADLAATLPLDSNGRLIDGVFYDPKNLAVSGYRGILAIRLGSELLLVFTST